VRFTRADPRVDADRGCVALERGPLVYCLEEVDNAGQRLDDVIIDTDAAVSLGSDPALPGMALIAVQGVNRPRPEGSWWPYQPAAVKEAALTTNTDSTTLTAVPYLAWGNRREGAMRVWIPAE
jgi:DUF1680 family protein